MRRKGRMYLVLILPDGSKSMVPAEWTDFALLAQPASALDTPALTIGSLEHLLHTRAVVDALLSRLAAVANEDATKESPIASKKSEPLRSSPRRNVSLGNIARRTQDPCGRDSGTTDR
jgi:hypothetical protein